MLRHGLGAGASLEGVGHVFIEHAPGEMIPYFLDSVKIRNAAEMLVRFEGVRDREAAEALLQKKVWLQEEKFRVSADPAAAAVLLGYELFEGRRRLGEILEVVEQPNQILCRILLEGREVLIPLHEGTLQKIDHARRRVKVRLPEGLLDIFR